jgi:hypothetical protein
MPSLSPLHTALLERARENRGLLELANAHERDREHVAAEELAVWGYLRKLSWRTYRISDVPLGVEPKTD